MPKFEKKPQASIKDERVEDGGLEDEKETAIEGAEESETDVEKEEPSLREIGRERIERIGSFFTQMKEGFKDKVTRTGEALSSAASKAKGIGIAGLETAMATPEALGRGLEFGVGAAAMAYEKGRETVAVAKSNVLEAKDAVIQRGKEAVAKGVQVCVEAKEATIEFGNHALYRAAERVSRPFLEFQSRRLSHTLRYMAERVESGKVNKDDYEVVKKLLSHLEGLNTV